MTGGRPAAALHDETSLRRRCAEQAGRGRPARALRRLAYVGALRCDLGAGDADSLRMARSLDYLLRSGVAIDPEFEIDVVNLVHGRDFLAEQATADLVAIAVVPDLDHRMFPRVEDEVVRRQLGAGPRGKSFFWQARSSRHTGERWRSRVAETGARLLLCFGGEYEVGTRVFAGTDWVTVIPTPAFPWQPPHRGWTVEQLYGGRRWDVPFRWFGLMASSGFLREWSAGAGDRAADTLLAAELDRLARGERRSGRGS